MKILVIYHSETGNTQKIAEIINETISKDNDSKMITAKNAKNEKFEDYDLIFVGSACHSSDFAKPILKLLEKLPESPKFKLAGFLNHSTYLPEPEDDHKKFLHEKWAGNAAKTFERICKKKNIQCLGYFTSLGKPSKAIEIFIRKQIITDDDEWEVYFEMIKKHPNEEDFQNAKKFAQEVITKM